MFCYKIKTDENFDYCEATIEQNSFFARAFDRRNREWARSQEYADYPGIYVLLGPKCENKRRVYIGQSVIRQSNSGVVNRMYERNAHNRILDWETGIMFIWKDLNYFRTNSNRLYYLEHSLIGEFKRHQSSYKVENKDTPHGTVDEGDRACLDQFIGHCKQFLSFIGVPIHSGGINGLRRDGEQNDVAVQLVGNSDSNASVGGDVPSGSSSLESGVRGRQDFCQHDDICPPEESGITVVFRHCSHGEIRAQIYKSGQGNKWILCKGTILERLTTATSSIVELRRRYAGWISQAQGAHSKQKTLREIPFKSRNQAALFVCGTRTRQASAYWDEAYLEAAEGEGATVDSLFYFNEARGRIEGDRTKFTVLRGSRIAIDPPGEPGETIRQLRRRYADKVVGGIVQEDCTFTSPSAAANFVAYRSSNGRKEWKNIQGRSLGDVLPEVIA